MPTCDRLFFSQIREIFGRRDVHVSGRPDEAPRKLDGWLLAEVRSRSASVSARAEWASSTKRSTANAPIS